MPLVAVADVLTIVTVCVPPAITPSTASEFQEERFIVSGTDRSATTGVGAAAAESTGRKRATRSACFNMEAIVAGPGRLRQTQI
jgi:hypothetical protein